MFKILTLNNISITGLDRLPRDCYEVASEIQHPDAIMLRSYKMHDMELADSVLAVGRAGAGVNNIPVDKMSERGIPVFNAPGANANAVKELVIAGMLLACRNICQGWDYSRGLEGSDHDVSKAVEQGKKQYVGFELPGRTLGVVGLGAIGIQVANAALALGMKVIGFDPDITVDRAWQLSSDVEAATSADDLLTRADFVTFHVPLVDSTKNMINAQRLSTMKDGVVLLNFARDGIIEESAMIDAIDSGKVYAYVCDFPSNGLKGHDRVITLPHLGASTKEAEDNCAVMIADQLRAFLEDGNITNSVNFPTIDLPRNGGSRLVVVNRNVPNMVGQISTCLADASLNIIDLLNKSRGDIACTIVDLESDVTDDTLEGIVAIDGVLSARLL
ncbi:MAG TPA: 3-phosphoglycerate dehydrogenase [Chromatiaceae bacterium]|jgi:D-3-phosphoglycerate dehydrogenase|nr:3-phosphoglycerate dehydrogenase [Chromatiaceae bacterium]HIB84285.1 3-phosphoglycerate dehydrogenase [Chromatiaceae bacterium]HIN81402.1 3-phosphoglycerate dehydrogenase [Chromatiales bacterium]HIO15204.1 3-phosphoglycerate dehydrogenase [Chromatiales bacterium]HIO55178.1 3-phosphoglycerate dehydrogenase [Chromatiales bacterium]